MESDLVPMGVALLALFVGAVGAFGFRISERTLRGPGADAVGEGPVQDDVAAVLAALPTNSVLLDASDRVLRADPEAYPLGLVRGNHLAAPAIVAMVGRVRETGAALEEVVRVDRADGAPLAFDVRVAPLSGSRVLVLAADTTERTRLDEVRRDFVANVSHELKTPVGAIALLAETAADAADDPEAVRRFADRMGMEARRLSALVQEIIDLSRLQSPDGAVVAEDVEIDGVLAEAVDRVRILAGDRDVTVTVGGDRGLHVHGDRHMLVQAVRNLLDNAIRYSGEGERVAVGCKLRDDVVEIAVVDQGVGLKEQDTERVFERFFRVDQARSRETGGTGLGLSIVKHVAANHGGSVSVWSRPGRGSTFTLRLPSADPGARAGEEE